LVHVVVEQSKIKNVILPATSSITTLLGKISEKLKNVVNVEDMSVTFGGAQYNYDDRRTLADCNIVYGSTLVLVTGVHGGTSINYNRYSNCPELKDLPGYVTVTTTEQDMISLDDSPDEKRAKMPCGHVIGRESLKSHCQSLLSKGMSKFTCPDVSTGKICGKEWPYFVVRHVICFTEKENAKFEQRLSENYLNRASGIQQCPGCETWCCRKDKTTNRVTCAICTRKNKKNYDFCWVCLGKWIGFNSKLCGNADCDGTDKRIGILAKCPTKDIGQKIWGYEEKCEILTMRGCPKCGIIIEHKTKCKHMQCEICKHEFCFACLKPKPPNGRWVCSAYGNECGMAARQRSLPGD